MAKKSSKHQSKPVNATVPATSQPADTSQVDIQVPAATRLQFFDFITLAAMDDVKEFLKIASTKPEGENLVTLWRRAHSEGYENGRKSVLRNLEKKMDEKYEEGIERGMNLGREEGYTVAKGGFDHILAQIKAREDSKRPITSVSGTQTDLEATTTSVSAQTESTARVSCQTQMNFIRNTSSTSTGTQMSSSTTQTTSTTSSPSPAIAMSHPSLSALPSSRLPTSTTVTTTIDNSHSTASNRFETPLKRRHSLPDYPTTLHPSPQTPFTPQIRRYSFTTSSTLTATSASKNIPKMSNQATFRDQKVPATSETTYTTSNEVQVCPETQEPEAVNLHDDEQAGTSRHTVSSLEHAGSLWNVVRWSRSHTTPSSTPRKPATTSATSATSATSTTSPTSGNPSLSSSTTLSSCTAPSITTTGLKTPSSTTCIAQKHSEPHRTPVSNSFSWADDTEIPPVVAPVPPSYPPRDFSGLRSTSTHPFSSLRRRHHHPKWQRNNQHRHCHSCRYPHWQHYQHYPSPYSQPPPAISLDWDQDPRLLNLSNALHALGWVRR